MEPTLLPTFTPVTSSDETKRKNLFALVIILTGLFVGSLFVDVAQIVTGSGFSGTALREQTVLETTGKTWVAYTEPVIGVQVITDDACVDCVPDEALLWMRRIVPTLSAKKVAYDSFEGKELIARHGIKSLPAFVFEKQVETTDFYLEAAPLFQAEGNEYFFDMNKIGLPVGKYLVAPEYSQGDIRLGHTGATTTMTIFTDFACEYCKSYHATYKKLIEIYGDRVTFVIKHFPLPNHPQAETAAMAASCAHAQNLFLPYSDILFERQGEWSARTDSVQTLKNYAWRVRGMNGRDFAACMDEKRFVSLLEANMAEGAEFNLQAAPATFINEEFLSGDVPQEDLQTLLDERLSNGK